MLKSKLKSTFPTADSRDRIVGNTTELDPVFAGRLAYIAKVKGVKIKLTEGYRSTARQAELYNQYLEYKRTGKGSIKLAAKPGTSWHEFRLAVDTSTQPIRGMTNAELAQYGLCKPIKSEGWHIQPIETLNSKKPQEWAPEEVEEKEKEDMTRDETLQLIKEVLAGQGDTPSAWAKESWEHGKQDGITDGTRPQGYCTREQVVAMIERGK